MRGGTRTDTQAYKPLYWLDTLTSANDYWIRQTWFAGGALAFCGL